MTADVDDLGRQFDAFAARWDAEHGPASPRAAEFAARVAYLRAICREQGRPRVLDLGCATGQRLLHLADAISAGMGVDVSPAMISTAQRNAAAPHLQFHVADAGEFCRTRGERFDLVLLVGVLPHIPDQAGALAAAQRLLAPYGRLIVISPHPWGPAFRLKRLMDGGRDAPPAHHLSPPGLQRLANAAGLRLAALRALPYAPWPRPRAGAEATITGQPPARRHAFTGVYQGAFAAEFRRRG